MAITDTGLKAIRGAYGFFLNSNFTVSNPGFVTTDGSGTKTPTIDEFFGALPFEAYERDLFEDIYPAQPLRKAASSDNKFEPAYLPGTNSASTASTKSGTLWFTSNTESTSDDYDVAASTDLDDPVETFRFVRIVTEFRLDKLQAQMLARSGGSSVGPDALMELRRAAHVTLLRTVSRDALNRPVQGLSDVHLAGLNGYFSGTHAPSGSLSPADPQVIKSSVAFTGPPTATEAAAFLTEVRKLLRRVSTSEDGFGAGANALVMSRRTRDMLIRCERILACTPQFIPTATGGLKYHFDGVPTYVGPVREDESSAASSPEFQDVTVLSDLKYSSIYALRLGGRTGIRMLHYGGDTEQHGVQVEELSGTAGNVTVGYRLTGYYTLFIPERQAGARLWAIDLSREAD